MKLCEDNRTYAISNLNVKELLCITEDRKSVSGIFGSCMESLFGAYHKRKCTLVGHSTLGGKDPKTGNYSGNLGLLQRGEASAYLDLVAPLVNEDWLKISIPMKNEEFHAFHELEEVKNDKKIDLADNFFSFKLGLLAGFLSACLLYLLFKFLIVICKRSLIRQQLDSAGLIRKFAAVSFSSSAKYRIAALSLLVLFFGQFLWFSTIVVTSRIKTDTVIVDTSKIIANADDAFKSERTLCNYKDGSEHKISVLSGEKNVLRRLFEKKARVFEQLRGTIKGDYCLLQFGPETATIDTSKIFLISPHHIIMVMAVYLKDLKARWVGFLSKPIYSLNYHIYHVFRPDEEAFIRTITFLYTENGVYGHLSELFIRNGLASLRKQDRLYTSLIEYKEDSSYFENLSIENFRSIFILFFLVCTLLLLTFLLKIVYLKLARNQLSLLRLLCVKLYRTLARNLSTCKIFVSKLSSLATKLCRK